MSELIIDSARLQIAYNAELEKNASMRAALIEAQARVKELERQLAEASTHKDVWRDKWENAIERAESAEVERDRLKEQVAHWQEEYRDAISRYQRMIEERNGLRAALEEIERCPCGDKNCNASEIATAAINPVAPIAEGEAICKAE